MTDSTALATRNSDELRVFSLDGFDAAQRMAKALASSTLVPKIYQGQEGLPNCLIALELSSRLKISPMVVMQNMVPIHGRPSWSSQFLIGTVNACGRFSPLRYILDNEDEPTSCYCEAKDLASGETLRGEKITIAMAKAQGWWSRKDSKGAETSKWPTMTGQMLRFRAASWWQRVHCPELSLGLLTQEEAIDVEAVTVTEDVPAAAIAPAVPEPLTYRAAETVMVAAAGAATTELTLTSAPDTESQPTEPESAAAPQPAPSDPEPAEPGKVERLPKWKTIIDAVAAAPQSASTTIPAAASQPAPIDSLATPSTPATARRTAPLPVRRSAPAAASGPDAPIPGLD